MNKLVLSLVCSFFLFHNLFPQTVTDYNGNEYPIITIGQQQWMAKNLETTHYRNGDALVEVLSAQQWQNQQEGAYRIYDNDDDNRALYGLLYNWHVVHDSRGICPVGWTVPDEQHWKELLDSIDPQAWGNRNVMGVQLRDQRQVGSPIEGYDTDEHPRWDNHYNRYGTDDYGFAALPAGTVTPDGNFANRGSYAYFWSSDQSSASHAWARVLLHSHAGASQSSYPKTSGFSIRCVKEQDGVSPEPQEYELSIAISGQGTTVPAAGTYSHAEGTLIDLQATPALGWEFDRWVIGEVEIFEPQHTLVMKADISATVHFREEENGENGIPSLDFNGTTLYISSAEPETTLEWGGDGTTTNAQSDTDGQSNTQIIISTLENNDGVAYAAEYCDNLNYEGHTDWYLPAKDELDAIYEARLELGDFLYNFYWSSTEYNHRFAWYQSFEMGFQDFEARKFNTMGVRCIRKD